MAFLTFAPDYERKNQNQNKTKKRTSWNQIKNLLSCKQIKDSKLHHPSTNHIYTSRTKTCASNDVVRGVADKPPEIPAGGQVTPGSSSRPINSRSVRSSGGCGAAYTRKGKQLRKLSGCYECHFIVDLSRFPLERTNIYCCSQCGEVFPKIESLEFHQAVKHAVSQLGPADSSRNIVEIIFKSGWLKKEYPICKIERIVKVQNSQRTIQRFEDYRSSVKLRAKRNARCAADGNELLRFHAATLTCSLGSGGSSSLCGSIPACGVCTIIRHGFQSNKINGICTTATSGCADDHLGGADERKAMLVCRVIAGRVKPRRVVEDAAGDQEGSTALADGSFDSSAGCAGVYSTVEELFVFSSRAILPCFVVIYKALKY